MPKFQYIGYYLILIQHTYHNLDIISASSDMMLYGQHFLSSPPIRQPVNNVVGLKIKRMVCVCVHIFYTTPLYQQVELGIGHA